MGNIRLGKVIGIPIELNYSWFAIFFLIFWSLAFYLFPSAYPRLHPSVYWIMGGTATILFFASLIFHELSHSYVSQRYGMKVDRIVLFLFGGVSETFQEMPSAKAEFWVAIAGPLASFFLAIAFLGGGVLSRMWTPLVPVAVVMEWLGFINIVLGVFNLLPGFPLDGGRVLRSIIWYFSKNQRTATRIASRTGQFFAGMLMFWGFFRLFGGNFVGGIWLIFLGWLLFAAASSEYSELVLRQALNRVRVEELMSLEVKAIPPELSLSDAIHEYFLRYPYGGYPVTHADKVLGIISLGQIREIPKAEWDRKTVKEVMLPLPDGTALHPQDTVTHALEDFRRTASGRLPVMRDGELVGILSQSDVVRWLNAHPEAENDPDG